MTATTGRCLCGKTTFEFASDAVLWCGLCHCECCRRACSAPVVAWLGVQNGHWRWTGADPKHYKSSDWADRYFCADCGSQMGYETDKLPNEFHFLGASLDVPENYRPEAHFFHSKALGWLHIDDDLPRYLDGGKTLET